MKRYFVITLVCVLAAAASLSLAFMLAGYWLILPVFIVMAVFWIVLKKWSVFRTSSALLSLFLILAAIGVTVNASMPLLLVACTTALAGWDLTTFAESLTEDHPSEASLRLERYHLQALGIAASTGLTLACITSLADFQIPFAATLLFGLLAAGGLTYGVQSLMKKS